MRLTVIGSIAFDSVETINGKRDNVLGGSATYASLAASVFSPVNLISVVGMDFSEKYFRMFKKHKINTEGLEKKKGNTFRWEAKYHDDLCHRDTLGVSLNVFEDFRPIIPKSIKREDNLFLANIDPDLQDYIFQSIKPKGLVACDTMDHWITNKKKPLIKLLKKIDLLLLNDEEAQLLSGENNLLKAAKFITSKGVRMVVIKKGEHGALFFSKDLNFIVPSYLVDNVVDPTGAGDTFAGGMMGYLTGKKKINNSVIRESLVYGSILASYTVQKFSIEALEKATKKDINARYRRLSKLVKF